MTKEYLKVGVFKRRNGTLNLKEGIKYYKDGRVEAGSFSIRPENLLIQGKKALTNGLVYKGKFTYSKG